MPELIKVIMHVNAEHRQRDVFLQAGHLMVSDHGAEAIVLAGTDLNLAFDNVDPGYPVIDALDVHVERLAEIATGTTL